jgi:hypothetical protein
MVPPQVRTGLPKNTKATPRADFIAAEFDQLLITKGYDVWWSRSGLCPCSSTETDQPDPVCGLCKGRGRYYFLPDPAIAAGGVVDDSGNPVVKNEAGDAIKIRAHISSLSLDTQVFEKFGEWVFGGANISVQAQNRLGYRDRLQHVDSQMVWMERFRSPGASVVPVIGSWKDGKVLAPGLRYGLTGVHQLRSLDTVYREGTDFELSPRGEILWRIAAPAEGTILSVHGTAHPVWAVLEYPHALRDTQISVKGSDVATPLPVQVAAKLDFLVPD